MKELITKARRRAARDFITLKKRARRQVARAVYSLPRLSHRNPRRRIVTFNSYCQAVAHFPARTPVLNNWYLPLRPPEMIHRTGPVSLNEREAEKFRASALRYQYGFDFQMPEVFLACVNQARVYSEDFLVLSPDDRIFIESALCKQEILENNGILERLFWPAAGHRRKQGFLLAQETPNAYYHWLIEMLPKLSLLEEFPQLQSVPLIVASVLKPFQEESLKMLGIPQDRTVRFDGGCCEFEQLFFPALLGPTGCPSPHAVAWLRRRFLPHAKPSGAGSKRIYITRRDAPARRILNEPEIIACLEKRGFKVICPGEMSLAEQIGLFKDVEAVVAAHGAGSTNMVFAPRGATLIELFGDNYINGCFWALANICGQDFGFVSGPATWLDYTIAVNDLEAILDTILN